MEFQTNLFEYRKVTLKHFVLPALIALLLTQTLSYAEIFTGLQSIRSVGTATNALFTVGVNGNSENLVGFALPSISTGSFGTTSQTSGIVNGYLSVGGDSSCDSRGFVWDTVSRSDPGNVAPNSSSYVGNFSENGAFTTGNFSHSITGLVTGSFYYYRAAYHTETGWVYGNEASSQTSATNYGMGTLLGLMAVVVILIFLTKLMSSEITLETIIVAGVLIILAVAFIVSLFSGISGI